MGTAITERRFAQNIPAAGERPKATDDAELADFQNTAADIADGLGNIGKAGWGAAFPRAANVIPGQGAVTPDIALEILRNIAEGKPPFKPELGKYGVTWLATGGNPYIGQRPQTDVTIPVEVKNPTGKPVLQFGENELTGIYNSKIDAARTLAEQQYRQKNNLQPKEPISNRGSKTIEYNAGRIAETEMWKEVGKQVRESESGMGKVALKNSRFSHGGDGEFTVTSRPDSIAVKGGAQAMMDIVRANGAATDSGLKEAAEKLAAREKWVGRIQSVFRYGGRVFIVVGAAADGWRIYQAEDKVKMTVQVGGGWTGAISFGSAFAAWYAPADVAGPWAWVGHGVGTLIAGGIGYAVGHEVTRMGYELAVEGRPFTIRL